MLFVFTAAYGLIKIKNKPIIRSSISITLIIPVRNEESNIDLFFDAIYKIDYPELKIIFVDDFSQDNTYAIIVDKIKSLPFAASIIKNNNPGKKQALMHAMDQCQTDFVMTTDMDCILKTDNLYLVADTLNQQNDMVCGPVLIKQDSSFFSKLQYYDQLSLTTAAAGMGNAGFPFMCSAANMGFHSRIFMELKPYRGNLHIHTGDDVFLLEKLKRNHKKITWLFSCDSVVYTQAQTDLGNFFRQRIRWAQKATVYKNYTAILTSVLVLLINALLLFYLLILPFYTFLWYITAKYLLIKAVFDILFLFLAACKLGVKFNPLYALCSFFFHMVYVPPIALASLFINTTWKGRRVEQGKHEQ